MSSYNKQNNQHVDHINAACISHNRCLESIMSTKEDIDTNVYQHKLILSYKTPDNSECLSCYVIAPIEISTCEVTKLNLALSLAYSIKALGEHDEADTITKIDHMYGVVRTCQGRVPIHFLDICNNLTIQKQYEDPVFMYNPDPITQVQSDKIKIQNDLKHMFEMEDQEINKYAEQFHEIVIDDQKEKNDSNQNDNNKELAELEELENSEENSEIIKAERFKPLEGIFEDKVLPIIEKLIPTIIQGFTLIINSFLSSPNKMNCNLMLESSMPQSNKIEKQYNASLNANPVDDDTKSDNANKSNLDSIEIEELIVSEKEKPLEAFSMKTDVFNRIGRGARGMTGVLSEARDFLSNNRRNSRMSRWMNSGRIGFEGIGMRNYNYRDMDLGYQSYYNDPMTQGMPGMHMPGGMGMQGMMSGMGMQGMDMTGMGMSGMGMQGMDMMNTAGMSVDPYNQYGQYDQSIQPQYQQQMYSDPTINNGNGEFV